MTKQLDDMWTSKWVLPEHKVALIEDDRSLKRKVKPELDEQEITLLNKDIQESLGAKRLINLTIFGTYVDRLVSGQVIKVDALQIKVSTDPSEDEYEWILLGDIIKSELKEETAWDELEW